MEYAAEEQWVRRHRERRWREGRERERQRERERHGVRCGGAAGASAQGETRERRREEGGAPFTTEPILRWTWWAHTGGGDVLAFKQPTHRTSTDRARSRIDRRRCEPLSHRGLCWRSRRWRCGTRRSKPKWRRRSKCAHISTRTVQHRSRIRRCGRRALWHDRSRYNDPHRNLHRNPSSQRSTRGLLSSVEL